jgi:phage terminase small subunit
MAERDAAIAEAVEEAGQVVEMAIRLERPTAALSAIELKLKLRGIVHDRRFSLYTESPDDDLATCWFDPQEDEDPPLEPLAEAPAPPAEPPPAPPAEPPAAAPAAQPQDPKPRLSTVKTGTAPAAASASAGTPPVLRIPPVPPRVLEAFDVDGKTFPTVCPSAPEDRLSP